MIILVEPLHFRRANQEHHQDCKRQNEEELSSSCSPQKYQGYGLNLIKTTFKLNQALIGIQ